MKHRIDRLWAVGAALALATACADSNTGPSMATLERPGITTSAVKYWEAGATVAWNKTARDLIVARAQTAPHIQLRILAYLTLAQYNAAVTAEDTKDRGTHASPAAAIGGASVVVLKSFFPLDGDLIDARLAEQLAATPWPGEKRKDAATGEAVGRAVGADVVAYAAADNFNVNMPTPAPGGLAEGYWVSATPSVRALYGARTFFLTSEAQFRSAPPPAFGSAAFLTDLDEVRTIALTRTPEQIAEAQFWAAKGATFLNEVGAELIVAHRKSEREAAHILALANMTAFDAMAGCWDAKFAYWYIRPTQADPTITVPAPLVLPNHPSYISGHSCQTASFATVLSHAFPTERARFDDYVVRAGLSRIYAGFHFRFDVTAGQELGRAVGQWALDHDVGGHEPFPLD